MCCGVSRESDARAVGQVDAKRDPVPGVGDRVHAAEPNHARRWHGLAEVVVEDRDVALSGQS